MEPVSFLSRDMPHNNPMYNQVSVQSLQSIFPARTFTGGSMKQTKII